MVNFVSCVFCSRKEEGRKGGKKKDTVKKKNQFPFFPGIAFLRGLQAGEPVPTIQWALNKWLMDWERTWLLLVGLPARVQEVPPEKGLHTTLEITGRVAVGRGGKAREIRRQSHRDRQREKQGIENAGRKMRTEAGQEG